MKTLNIDKYLVSCGRISADINLDKIIVESTNKITKWKDIIKKASLHRIDPFVYFHLKRLDLLDKIPDFAAKQLKNSYEANKKRNALYISELDRILTLFNKNNIKAVLLKGAYLIKTVYNDIGLRKFSDIDILVRRRDFKKASNIMEQLGYKEGEYNWKDKKIETFDRITNLLKQRYSGHIRFLKKTGKDYCPVLAFEIHFDLFFKGEDREYRVSMDGFWKDIENNENEFYSLSIVNNLIYFCFHTFHDATDTEKQKFKTAVRLLRFCDLRGFLMAFKNRIDWNSLTKLTIQYGLELPVYFTLSNLNNIYGRIVPEKILRKLEQKKQIIKKKVDHNKNIKKLLNKIHQTVTKNNEN